MVTSNLIYSFQELRALILSKAEQGAYFLTENDFYFEEIDKNTNLVRNVFVGASNRTFSVTKYIEFKLKDDYTTKEMFEFVKNLEQENKILLTIFNQKKKSCFILFVGSKNDEILENKVSEILKMEE